jgi:hypothetical protein
MHKQINVNVDVDKGGVREQEVQSGAELEVGESGVGSFGGTQKEISKG